MLKNIMLVDDDRELLIELEERLISENYKVVSFYDSESALKMVRKIMPDLIMLDIKMDKKNGFQFASELKINPETSAIPIIAMTGYYSSNEPLPLMDFIGVKFCLFKPFDSKSMIEKIEEALFIKIKEESMGIIRKELIDMMNRGLELEQAARIQYLAHAELIKGMQSEKIIERLKEIASDEQKHEEKFRTLISDYLDGKPSMGMAETHDACEINEILEINLKGEKEAIDFYKAIYFKITENKKEFQYEFEMLEHEIRHIIVEEQEHVTELKRLLGK